MITIILRVFITYILVLFVFRLMGKRQLGQMQPFEFVLTLIIADLATIPMAESSVPLLNGIVPLLTLVVFHFVITLLSRKSNGFSKMISGKPVIIINPKGIDYDSLKRLNITIDDLFEAIRTAGYFSIEDVEFAIMETNGQVSVMPKAKNAPVTNQDMGIKKTDSYLPITIISEGKFMKDNLLLTNKNKDFFINILKKNNINSIKNIILLTINKQGNVFLQENSKPYKSFNLEQEL